MFLTRLLNPSRVSAARACLIRAEALKDYKHYDEALIEAKKARDMKEANPVEIELAKGKIVEVLQAMEQNATGKSKLSFNP